LYENKKTKIENENEEKLSKSRRAHHHAKKGLLSQKKKRNYYDGRKEMWREDLGTL